MITKTGVISISDVGLFFKWSDCDCKTSAEVCITTLFLPFLRRDYCLNHVHLDHGINSNFKKIEHLNNCIPLKVIFL